MNWNWTMIVNVAANCVLTVGFGAFLIFLFGRENSMIHRLKGYHSWFVKCALGLCGAGALYNVLTVSDPPVSEVVMNTGLALLFSWAAWFHYMAFVVAGKAKGGGRRRKKAK